MRLLLAATCLTPAALLVAGAARADTTIGGSTSSPIATSTAAGGSPDNVIISSGVTVSPPSGTAVTINSSNTVSNAGTISFSGIDNTTGIGGGGGFTTGLTNSGTITVDETFTASDTTGDGLIDAPFAQGTGRYGIHLTGTGAFGGSVLNSGTVTVKGNTSAGIVSDVAITGNFTSTGAVTLTGDNGYGIKLNDVGGLVAITGATSATGTNSVAVDLAGNVTGEVVIHSALSATGYTATTLPASTVTLNANDLLQGGSALVIGGNVGGGVLLAAAPTDTTNTTIDSDADGIADASEGTATITSYGSAPTLLVGSASHAITLGTFTGTTSGLVNNGTITANGVYPGISATAVQIGGLGGTVTIAGGITNTGNISASSNSANAIAIHLGAGAATPLLTNSGTISSSSTTATGGTAAVIVIDAGASLPAISTSGTISAVPAVSGGSAYAIRDLSGTLTSLANTGTIISGGSASGSTAIDVQANTSGFTYTQALASSTATAPSITGAILTGSGNDQILASAGTLTSAISTGAGNDLIALSGTAALSGSATFGNGNDSLKLADTSSFAGTATFGTGTDTFSIGSGASFSGTLVTSAANVAVSVNGGTLSLTGTGAVALRSLTANGGTIGVTIDPVSGAHSELDVAGATTFTGSPTIKVSLASLPTDSATYTVIRSGTMSGSSSLGFTIDTLPYLLSGSLAPSDANGTVAVAITRKTPAQLGFTRSEAAAYNAVYADIVGNSTLSGLFLSLGDRDSLVLRYRQMLPDHAGGVFDVLSQGVRNLAPSENVTPWGKLGDISFWAQQGYWNATQDAVNTPGYKETGWGLSAGGDIAAGPFGRFGLSIGYIFGDVKDASRTAVTVNQYQGGVYWLADWGGLHLSASGTAGYVRAEGKRFLTSTDTNTPTLLTSVGKWNGLMIAGIGKASYEAHLGAFYLRPSGTISYARLHEGSYADSGGGAAFDLIVDGRSSSELAATGLMALGVQFGNSKDLDATAIRLEVEGGRRQIVSSTVGSTTAHFAGGATFSLLPEDRDSGYVGTVRASVGNGNFRFIASASTETRDGYHTIVGRVGLRGSF